MTSILCCDDVRNVLARIPERSVQCVVTSPPYFGLRSYMGPPTVWGGDLGCAHDWATFMRSGISGGSGEASAADIGGPSYSNIRIVPATEQAVCRTCGADRGWLGLEPTPEQYVAHLVEVFRGVWRVLCDDGVFFLVLGDSYVGSNKGMGAGGRAYGGPKQRTNAGSIGVAVNYRAFDTRPGRTARVGATRNAVQGRGIVVSGLTPKGLIGIPWRVALALQADGWTIRNDIIWHKPNAMSESVRDRFTRSHEYVFMLTKRGCYQFNAAAVAEPAAWNRWGAQTSYKRVGRSAIPRDRSLAEVQEIAQTTRNRRTVWTINTKGSDYDYCGSCDTLYVGGDWRRLPFIVLESGRRARQCPKCQQHDQWIAHYAAFPRELVDICVRACTSPGDVVLDPFVGSGTTLLVAASHGRIGVGVDSSKAYITLSRARLEHAGEEVQNGR